MYIPAVSLEAFKIVDTFDLSSSITTSMFKYSVFSKLLASISNIFKFISLNQNHKINK